MKVGRCSLHFGALVENSEVKIIIKLAQMVQRNGKITMQIIRCTSDDREYVIEAISIVKAEEDFNECSEKAIDKFLADINNYVVVAVVNGKVVGFAIAYKQTRMDIDKDMMCLYEIGVLEEYRRQGIASKIIEKLKNICREEEICKMWVPTNINNIPACSLYERTGGTPPQIKDEIIYTYRY